MPETKTAVIEGVKVLLQKCDCGSWFPKTRKDKESCSERCAMKKSKKWQARNQNKKPKKQV